MAIAMPELSKVIGANGVAWLVAGGLSYSVGAVFYTRTKMPLHHTIWHLFVLAGATCHFLVVVPPV